MLWFYVFLLYYLPLTLSQIILDKRQALASSACGNRDQTVGVCSPSTSDVWYNNTYHELTWKYNNPVFNGFETLTFYVLQQNSTSNYQQIKSFDVVHAVGVQVVLVDDSWYPSLLANNSPNVTRTVFAYLIGSGVDLQTELSNSLSIYPRPSRFTLIQNSHNTTSTTSIGPTASSTSSVSTNTPQQDNQGSKLPVWAIVIIVIAALAVTIAAIVLAWLIRNIRRNRQRDRQSPSKESGIDPNNTPLVDNAMTGTPIINTRNTRPAGNEVINDNRGINRGLSPHINTNDLSSSIHSSTPMLHGSIRGSPTAPSPSSVERSPSIMSNAAALNLIQQQQQQHSSTSDHQPTTTNSILSSTDALMIADTFRQFMRKPDWSDTPNNSGTHPQHDHHDETEEQKRIRAGNELLQSQLEEEGTKIKDIERR